MLSALIRDDIKNSKHCKLIFRPVFVDRCVHTLKCLYAMCSWTIMSAGRPYCQMLAKVGVGGGTNKVSVV